MISFSTIKRYFILILFSAWSLASAQIPMVDTSFALSPEEKLCIAKREAVAHQHILQLTHDLFDNNFNAQHHRLPRIAFCFSGGGNRALLTALGFMQAAEEIGLLPCASYISLLSGSSWFYLTYLLKNISLHDYRAFLQTKLELPYKKNIKKCWDEMQRIKKIRGSASLADGFGRNIYNYLLGDTVAAETSFSDIRDRLLHADQTVPFPLCTAIVKNSTPYKWLEVSPFFTGSHELGGFIPTEYFGSSFSNAQCTTVLPELSLASFMGIFGSAYCFNLEDFKRIMANRYLSPVTNFFTRPSTQTPSASQSKISVLNLLPNPIEANSKFNNFMFGVGNNTIKSSELIVADAGIDFNLPTPPLLNGQRAIDIIFICDASFKRSNSADPMLNLRKAQAYAKRQGLKFPTLLREIKIAENITVFQDQDKQTPTIIFFRAKAQTSTLKFSYSADEFNDICDQAKTDIINAKIGLLEAIRSKTQLINTHEA